MLNRFWQHCAIPKTDINDDDDDELKKNPLDLQKNA